jgi:hypothetical protein
VNKAAATFRRRQIRLRQRVQHAGKPVVVECAEEAEPAWLWILWSFNAALAAVIVGTVTWMIVRPDPRIPADIQTASKMGFKIMTWPAGPIFWYDQVADPDEPDDAMCDLSFGTYHMPLFVIDESTDPLLPNVASLCPSSLRRFAPATTHGLLTGNYSVPSYESLEK